LRILVIHRYFWPDTPPYAVMLRRIVERWHQDGHQVEVLSSQASYKSGLDNQSRPRIETLDGVRIQRLSLPGEAGRPFVRLFNALRLSIAILWKAVTGRFDVIMISTVPPVIGGAVAALSARLIGARFIYHCMDIHPEVGRISGEFANPGIFRALAWLDSWSCRHADPVVVLSGDMERTLRARQTGERFRVQVLNNFSLPSDQTVPVQLPFKIDKGKLTVLFAGNIGRFQGLEFVIEAMAAIRERNDIELLMMGEGVAKADLMKRAESLGCRIRFLGHQPIAIAKQVMRQVDAGIVSLVSGLYRYAYPSKTMTYLEQGCPLIIAVEHDSELATAVRTEGFGYCVPVGNSDALANLLIQFAEDRSRLQDMRGAAYRKWQSDFSESVVLDQWSRMLLITGNSRV
jgi:colanic acid biosynthesis glycosyl transferase WcaI